MIVKNPLNFVKPEGKICDEASQTVPDQSLTVRQIMDRYAKGLPLTNEKTPIFEEENEPTNGINPKTLDLVDIQALKIENQNTIEELKNKANDEALDKKAKKAAQRVLDELTNKINNQH